jgi:type II secretory pathway pseudopilin PulG
MKKGNSWIGVVAAIAIGLFAMNYSDAKAEEREEERNAEIQAAYEEAYERGYANAVEDIEAYINTKGAEALRPFHVEFCCPNPYCQALIEYNEGDLPQVVAYRGYEGWEDICYAYVEFDY